MIGYIYIQAPLFYDPSMLSSLNKSFLHQVKSHSAVCYLLSQIDYYSPDFDLSLAYKQRSVLQDLVSSTKIALISVSGKV